MKCKMVYPMSKKVWCKRRNESRINEKNIPERFGVKSASGLSEFSHPRQLFGISEQLNIPGGREQEALFAAAPDKVDESSRLFFQVGAARPEVQLAFLIEHPHRVGDREPGIVHHVHV